MKTIFSLITLVVVFSSCVSTTYMTIDTRQPAIITVPSDIRNVLIVDNVPTEKDEPVNNNNRIDVISTDSAKTILLQSLGHFMDEERYFNSVNLFPFSTGIEGYYGSDIPLGEDLAANIAKKTSSDMIISLDVLTYMAELGIQEQFYAPASRTLMVRIGSVLRAYDRDGSLLAPPIIYKDSLYWSDTEGWDAERREIPDVNDAVKHISITAADMLVNTFIPSWRKESRWYYSDNSSDMKRAAAIAKEGNWVEAANIWGMIYDTEKKTNKRIRLASNIALANENMDDIMNALNWINLAYDMLPSKNESELGIQVVRYRSSLMDRVNNLERLEQQLGMPAPSE